MELNESLFQVPLPAAWWRKWLGKCIHHHLQKHWHLCLQFWAKLKTFRETSACEQSCRPNNSCPVKNIFYMLYLAQDDLLSVHFQDTKVLASCHSMILIHQNKPQCSLQIPSTAGGKMPPERFLKSSSVTKEDLCVLSSKQTTLYDCLDAKRISVTFNLQRNT